MSRLAPHRPAAACFLLAILCYLFTLPPTLTWAHYGADGGDLAAAVVLGRLPHPPGFPTYLTLGRLFLHLPWGDPARRLNLFSAFCAAAAAALLASGLRRSAIGHPQAAIVLALAPLFWSQALITEVYAPAAFFSTAVLFLSLRRAPPWTLGAVWGLGIGIHPTLLFLAPLMRCATPTVREGRTVGFAAARAVGEAVAVAFLVAGLLYGPVLLTHRGVPSPWASLDSLTEWWAYVSGRMYHGYLFALPLGFWPQRLLAYLGLLTRQFTPVGALLAVVGWARLQRERYPLALSTVLVFGLFSLYALGYDTADSLVYLVPALPIAALWLGVGLRGAAEGLERRWRRAGLLLLLLPLAQAVWGWGAMDQRGNDSAVRWARETLRAAPLGAVLVTSQDAATFTLWYVHDVLGERPDVLILDRDLWGHAPYRQMIAREIGEVPDRLSWPAGRPIREVIAPIPPSGGAR